MSAVSNPYVAPFACETCRDLRTVTVHSTSRRGDLRPCPSCGAMKKDEYERFRRAAWINAQPAVTLHELDLSVKEFEEYRKLRAEHPETSKTTILAWMEARRYAPERDPALVVSAVSRTARRVEERLVKQAYEVPNFQMGGR